MYVPSRMASAKDQPGQLTLKFRQEGQASAADIAKRDLRVRTIFLLELTSQVVDPFSFSRPATSQCMTHS